MRKAVVILACITGLSTMGRAGGLMIAEHGAPGTGMGDARSAIAGHISSFGSPTESPPSA